MKDILEKYCVYNNGLFLLPLPTGCGKTYNVFEYIFKHYKNNRKIFFITTLKKNLQEEDLLKRFQEKGIEKEYYKYCVTLDANGKTVTDSLLNTELPSEVTAWPEYVVLKARIGVIQRKLDADLVSMAEDEIRKKLEPDFRRKIVEMLNVFFKSQNKPRLTEKQKLQLVKVHYPWLAELYPAVLSSEKRVFFMSVDKFFLKNSTLIRPSYYFWEDDITKDALIFIDEFDATKKNILSQIIQNGFSKRLDLIGLFTQVYSAFSTLEVPDIVLKMSEKQLASGKNPDDLKQRFQEIKRRVIELAEKFYVSFPFKTVAPDTRRNFLFHDYDYHTILKEGKKFVRLEYSPAEHVNQLHFEEEMPDREKSFLGFLNQLRGFLTYFKNLVFAIASNYKQLKEEQMPDGEVFPIESALHSTLDLFNLPALWRNYLIDSILSNDRILKEKGSMLPDLNFYMNGFRYYDFHDSDEHDLKSKIYMFGYDNTPEKFLLNLAQKANIIGISATAISETVVGNYDLVFLKDRLGEAFRQYEEEERLRLFEKLKNSTLGYKNVNIVCRFLEVQNPEPELQEICNGDEEMAREIWGRITRINSDFYYVCRYIRYFKVLKEFICNPEIRSFLIIGMTLPKRGGGIDLGILQDLAAALIRAEGIQDEFKDQSQAIYVMNSEGFDTKKKEVHDILAQGYKLLVISTYQTLGAGQNLQYEAPADADLVCVNSYPARRREKDFDAIYVDRPTQMLVNLCQEVTEPDIVERIYQLEALAQKGEVSSNQLRKEIEKGFRKLSGNNLQRSNEDVNLYDRADYYNYAAKLLNQAIGRISRSNLKNKTIYIYSDKENVKYLQYEDTTTHFYTPEYRRLIEEAGKCDRKKSPAVVEKMKQCGESANKKGYTLIERSLTWINSGGMRIETWKLLREIVLTYPTLDQVDEIPVEIRELYVRLPENFKYLNYNQKYDFKEVEITFTNDENAGVSPGRCYLPDLMRCEELHELFREKGYAVDFRKAEYILSPVLFNNIYKGALGEEVGAYLVETYCGLPLMELETGEYELFDKKTEDGIYFDFKLWSEQVEHVDEEEYLNHIAQKKQKVNARKVFIINILGENYGKRGIERHRDNIFVVPKLYDRKLGKVLPEMLYDLKNLFYEPAYNY